MSFLMKKKFNIFIALLLVASAAIAQNAEALNKRVLYKVVDLKTEQITLHWQNKNDTIISTLGNLNTLLADDNKKLIFGMNGGMFLPDYSPVGLYIEDYKEIKGINISVSKGNFNLKPNGVFAVYNDNTAMICVSEAYASNPNIKYATQSGPMLLIDGQFHPAFNEGSSNLNIRNGVGILPDGNVVFAMSKGFINFYDFALFFKNLGCKNALYLDGRRLGADTP